MQHLDHERLVFLALGETEAESGEANHLDDCEQCRTEVELLTHLAGLGAGTQGLQDLPAPPERVWQGVLAEVAAAQPSPNGSVRHLPAAASATDPAAAGPATGYPIRQRSVDEVAPVGRRSAGGGASGGRAGSRRRWPGWVSRPVVAVAAAALGVVGTLGVLRGFDQDTPAVPAPEVVASTPLTAYGTTPPSARGDARVFKDGRLHLHVADLPEVDGYYEVWLINPANMQMFSVGVVGAGSDVLLPLPPQVDLSRYSVVDVSAEAFDNNTEHSGDSLLRGTLTS